MNRLTIHKTLQRALGSKKTPETNSPGQAVHLLTEYFRRYGQSKQEFDKTVFLEWGVEIVKTDGDPAITEQISTRN